MSLTNKIMLNLEDLPMCEMDCNKNEKAIHFCNNKECINIGKYYCLLCGDHHDHGPITS